jgi:hypothetical protein
VLRGSVVGVRWRAGVGLGFVPAEDQHAALIAEHGVAGHDHGATYRDRVVEAAAEVVKARRDGREAAAPDGEVGGW